MFNPTIQRVEDTLETLYLEDAEEGLELSTTIEEQLEHYADRIEELEMELLLLKGRIKNAQTRDHFSTNFMPMVCEGSRLEMEILRLRSC